jgi:hypothetical protein
MNASQRTPRLASRGLQAVSTVRRCSSAGAAALSTSKIFRVLMFRQEARPASAASAYPPGGAVVSQ